MYSLVEASKLAHYVQLRKILIEFQFDCPSGKFQKQMGWETWLGFIWTSVGTTYSKNAWDQDLNFQLKTFTSVVQTNETLNF